MRFLPSGLRARLLALVALTLLPALGLLFYFVASDRQAELGKVEDSAGSLAQMLSNQHSERIVAARHVLLALSLVPQVGDASVAPGACQQLLARVLAENEGYTTFAVIGPDGTQLCNALPDAPPNNVADRSYFQQAMSTGQFAVGTVGIGRVSGRTTLPLALPITDAAGTPRGVILTGLDLAWLGRHTTYPDLPYGSTVSVFDRNGTVLIQYPDAERWLGSVWPHARTVNELLALGEADGMMPGPDGTEQLFGFTRLGPTDDITLAVGMSADNAYADADAAFRRTLLGLALVAVFAALTAWYGGDMFILRGIRAVNDAALRLRHGDLSARAGLRSGSTEVRALAQTFDAMADELESRAAALAEAHQATDRERRRLRAILDAVPAGVFIADAGGRLVEANAGAAQIWGGPTPAAAGIDDYRQYRGFWADTGKELRPEDWMLARALTRGETTVGQAIDIDRFDGSRGTILASGAPVYDAGGQMIGAIATILDITERRQMEAAIAAQAEELQRSNADLEQFAYVASHDLQEPLRIVSSFSQLLARRYAGSLDARADGYISHMVDAAGRMQQLIQDLLEYSRVQTRGKEPLPVESESAVAVALANLRATIAESGATITHDPLPLIHADAVQVAQLFQNLIGNAIKFRGADPPRIHVTATRDGDVWRFSVQDNGIGIAPEHAHRVFDVFQRLHTRAEYPGTGIGLALCKKIVERLGGRIWVESDGRTGSTFCFTLSPGYRVEEIAA